MDNKPRTNQTDETYVPLSRGWARHLKNLSGNAVKVYNWLLIRAQFQGEYKGQVQINFKELALELGMHYLTVYKACRELKDAGYIDYIPAQNQWRETVFIVQKYKSIEDFALIHRYKSRETARLKAGKQHGNSTPSNDNKIKDLRNPNNDENVDNGKNVIKTADDLFISSCKTRNEKLKNMLQDLKVKTPDVLVEKWCSGMKARGRCYDADKCSTWFKEIYERIKTVGPGNIYPYVEKSIQNCLQGNGPGQQ